VTRLNALLLLALVLSAMYLVRVSYDARRLFAELHKAQNESHQLDVDFERLKSERQSQATPLRVEKAARDKLAMRTAGPAITEYINGPQRAAAASTAASGVVR
jgi:cell division protein FtsL